jgi:hypothetical protein
MSDTDGKAAQGQAASGGVIIVKNRRFEHHLTIS